jgi:hypothetical protein
MRRRSVMLAIAAGLLLLLVAGVATLGAAVLFAWPGPPEPAPLAVVPAKPKGKPERPPLPSLPGPTAPTEPDEAHPPSVYEAGHAAVAESLGLVAIRCWVGPEWDTEDLVGKYHQKISNGWYTNVEEQLVGDRGVEKRFEVPDVPPDADEFERIDFETLFVVSWRAERPGEMVPCEVHTLERAALRVRVRDLDGNAVPGATVYGCGSNGQSDARGLATLEETHASSACELTAYTAGAERMCQGKLGVSALAADEERAVDLTVECGALVEAAEDMLQTFGFELPKSDFPELSDEEEIARFRELKGRDLGPGADALLDGLIAHREYLIESAREWEEKQARQDELMRQIDAVAEKALATSDPVEKLRLMRQYKALTDEFLEL